MADQSQGRKGFIRVPVKLMPFVAQCLHSFGAHADAEAVLDFSQQYTDSAKDAERRAYITRGIETVANDGDLEIDDDCSVSIADIGPAQPHGEYSSGAYVMSWVWVENPNRPEGAINT